MDTFLDRLTLETERLLTWRKRRKAALKEKQKLKNPVVDWIEAFLWSAMMVLLVNQYFFQAYEIPSGSMVETLLIHDRLFVNKMVYGPELLPGMVKLPGYAKPQRGDIIIFENPSYLTRGPVFDLTQRLLYMLTLSFVDIDRDETGAPKVHFLIKRGAAFDGDRVRFLRGELEFRLPGESQWRREDEVKQLTGLQYHTRRMPEMNQQYYADIESLAQSFRSGLATSSGSPAELQLLVENFFSARDPGTIAVGYDPYEPQGLAYSRDLLEVEVQLSKAYGAVNPGDIKVWSWYNRLTLGQYVPRGWILPLGDNRDHSRDGRFFGPLPQEKILGQAALRMWPLARFGEMH